MIVVKLIGGIGNQMFQYAAGRRLAHKLGAELKLDVSGFEACEDRKYALGHFNIVEKIATRKEIDNMLDRKRSFAGKAVAWISNKPVMSRAWIKEKHFHFDPAMLELPDDVYLDGYWQSEKYFADMADVIRHEFAVKTQQTGRSKDLAGFIASNNSVSIHVRRGDYVTNPKFRRDFARCDVDYYANCVKLMGERVKNPRYFVFSDDPEWAKANLPAMLRIALQAGLKFIQGATICGHNGPEKAYEDLRLMSQCRHHIIANSSFSWWGAWLGSGKDKVVIAPKQWFNEERQGLMEMRDLMPSGCERM